jgi:hypothetical protein
LENARKATAIEAIGEDEVAGVEQIELDAANLPLEERGHVEHGDTGQLALIERVERKGAPTVIHGTDDLIDPMRPAVVDQRLRKPEHLCARHLDHLTLHRHESMDDKALSVCATAQAIEDVLGPDPGTQHQHPALHRLGVDQTKEGHSQQPQQHEGHPQRQRENAAPEEEHGKEVKENRQRKAARHEAAGGAQHHAEHSFTKPYLIDPHRQHRQHQDQRKQERPPQRVRHLLLDEHRLAETEIGTDQHRGRQHQQFQRKQNQIGDMHMMLGDTNGGHCGFDSCSTSPCRMAMKGSRFYYRKDSTGALLPS